MKKVISILAAVAINVFTVSAGSHSVGPINEIRDYTMEKDWFPQYVVWFEESFLPYLASRNVNVVSASVGNSWYYAFAHVLPVLRVILRLLSIYQRNSIYIVVLVISMLISSHD